MDVREKLIDLKPCPFCGSKPFVWRTNHRTYIECPNLTAESHRIMMSGKSDKEAIEAWNRRVGEEDKILDEQNVILAKLLELLEGKE